MSKEERIEKVKELILQGKVEFDPRCAEAVRNLNLKNPDRTLTEVELESAWGEWHRIGKDGTEFGNKGGFSINWMTKSAGCGTLIVFIDNDGKLRIDTQCMSREFCKEVICKLIDQAEEKED